jgi:hypothetical protein
MKPHRDAAALAASLTSAARAPLPLPQEVPVLAAPPGVISSPPPVEAEAGAAPPKKSKKLRLAAETIGITLRPDRDLLNRYTMAAAERTKKEGKVISAQQIMLEVLERGMQVKS